jgi:hypothetical protein
MEDSMTTQPTKLSAHTVWLFAFGSIAAGIGASYALAGFGSKVTAAVYFGVVAIGGFAGTYLTRARFGGAVLAFLAAAAVAAVAYFFLVSTIFATATVAVSDAASGGAAHGAAVEAGNAMGKMFGVFVAVIVFLETIVAGIAGSFAGTRSRGASGLSALAAMAKSAQ